MENLSTLFNSHTLAPGASGPLFQGSSPAVTPTAKSTPPIATDPYAKYRDAQGNILTPQQYADNVFSKMPSKNGDIPKFAGDAYTNPNDPALAQKASVLNNTRNDIATGTTDPYKVASKSGIAYTPAEMKAIESAYAGIYDPAIEGAKAKLAQNQEQQKQIFATNENIRQWRATTGTGPTYNSGSNSFTKTQVNQGASNAGMAISDFNNLDPDLKNFYINSPKGLNADGKAVPIYTTFEADLKDVADGNKSVDEVTQLIMDAPGLSPAVKHYFIDKMPAAPEQKQSWYQQIWSAIAG